MPRTEIESTIEVIKAVENRLHSLQEMGLELKTGEKLLLRAKRALKANKIKSAIEAINELGILLENAKKISIDFSNYSMKCQKSLKQARVIGIDISEDLELYNEAQELFKLENFSDAIRTIRECDKRIYNELYLFMTETIKEIYKRFKELPKNVIQSHEIRTIFNNADALINERDYIPAWKLIIQLQEIYINIAEPMLAKLHEQAKDKIIVFQIEIERASKLGADLTDANAIFSELIERMRNAENLSDYKEVIEYTSAGMHALERAVRRKERSEGRVKEVKAEFDRVTQRIINIKQNCAIPSSVEEIIKKAKAELFKGNYEKAIENIKLCNTKLDKLHQASDPKIIMQIDESSLRPILWNRTKISISNRGLATAKDIKIKLSGPLEVRRMPVVEQLGYNETKTFDIGLKIDSAGSVPIDMDVDFNRTLDGKKYHDHQELWLDVKAQEMQYAAESPVSTSPPTPHPNHMKSGIAVECLFCKKSIKKSTPIFKCSCETIYHLECITNLNSCLNCGAPIKHQLNIMNNPGKADKDEDEVDWD